MTLFHTNNTKASLVTTPWALFIFWVVFGLATSFSGLVTKTLYYDEIYETRKALPSIFEQIFQYAAPETLKRTSPPLYHLLLHPVLVVFGPTPFATRSISWLAGGINVALIYLLLKNLFASPWPILGTLGFMLSSWHIVLSQTARQHGLFLMFVLLGLLLFIRTEKMGKRFIPYGLALAAAGHTSYWGILVVLPAHFLATVLMRRQLTHWRQAVAAQIGAGLTTLVYLWPILRGYSLITGGGGGSEPWPSFTVPYFGSILADFSAANPGQFELFDLPWVGIVTLLVSAIIAMGALHWGRERETFPRWLGSFSLVCLLLLFPAYLAGASHMAWAPMLRKFAILQIPLLVSFLYGISRISRRSLRYGVFLTWSITTAVFGFRFMSSDLYKGSRSVAEHVARLPVPVTTFLNFDTSLPAEQGSLAFLLERMGASRGRKFRYFDFTAPIYPEISADGITCFSYMREGGYLQAKLATLRQNGTLIVDPDAKFNKAMQEIISRFHRAGWRTVVFKDYRGRIGFQLACFDRTFPGAIAHNGS
jgi:hypothetical protein